MSWASVVPKTCLHSAQHKEREKDGACDCTVMYVSYVCDVKGEGVEKEE